MAKKYDVDAVDAPTPTADESLTVSPVSIPEQSQQSPPEVVLDLNHIALDVFCTVHPLKDDQLAGFVHWANAQGHKRMPFKEWEQLLTSFFNKPVR